MTDATATGNNLLEGVNPTLWRVVVYFRALGWAWMLLLVVVALVRERIDRPALVVVAMVLATAWTAVTAFVMTPAKVYGSAAWFLADGVVALVVGAASTAAGSLDLIHGGYPMSWIPLAAYVGGIRYAIGAGVALGVEQLVVHLADDRGVNGAVGSVVFIVFAVAVGWAFDAVRRWERQQSEMRDRLEEEKRKRARHEERAELANQLHDSVLQTLNVIRVSANDPDQVRYLARRQERQLRSTIAAYRTSHRSSTRVALIALAGEIEDLYRVEVETVIRDDAELTPEMEAVVGAAREAVTNAAKHSGANRIDIFAELGSGAAAVYVRDRGVGFDPEDPRGARRGLEHSIEQRMAAVGGKTAITSAPGEGTEVAITLGGSDD